MDIINGQSLREAWDDLAQLHGDKAALIFEDVAGHTRQYGYAQLNDEINRAANLFSSRGISKGDRVALHLNNSVEFILCWFGLAKIGAIMVPINTHLLQEECAYIVAQCRVKTVVTRPEFLPIYLEIQQSQPELAELLVTGGCGALKGTANFDRLLEQQSAQLQSQESVSADDVAEIMFTSGTTSRPKGVVITHYNLRFAGYYTAWQTALRSDDIYLTATPAYHIDCQCTAAMAAFSAGATFVLLEKFSARAFWGQVVKYRATVTECIPLMMRTMMMQPRQPWERNHCLREVLFYLSMSDQEKDAFIDRFGVRIFTSWGMTETIVGIIGDRPGDKRRWPSIGRTGLCYQARITGPDGKALPPGEIGEIQVRGEPGKTLFKEYYQAPEITARAFTEDGWLKTGDSAYQDEEGFFFFVDRASNMIKRCGENVSCLEIENIISEIPEVVEAAVIGVKDSIRDEAIKAFVVLQDDAEISEQEILEYCVKNMAKFKVPSFIELRGALPKTCTGKVQKHLLCEVS
ncbi:crotonobetaine/carnitine-CoA ligase [Ferrimonas sediminicola]|uniref:Crotonobetaine/carnitine-CoA ligase n=1 Tax=Ferrimonas sediminicola TaxID=2569538 RepID=A0A4U1BEG7_9GAMM|nr:crotonobetaine/carnitine-CoA ligase [Ferrimonas sediminicola]TKB49245.1 crotonobetaine/carnitine-CoA ligase [Ferrimonas sediminicola]